MMNFNVSVGDLIKGIDLCRKLRRSFAAAPRQYQQIADQYVSNHALHTKVHPDPNPIMKGEESLYYSARY